MPRWFFAASELSQTAPTEEHVALNDRYLLGAVIGEGGMGVVHRAHDSRFDREVAIKLMKPGNSTESAAAMRFLVEAKITGQLQHPGIPPVHELGTLSDGRPFLAMKLVKGQTLKELLKKRTSPRENLGRFIAIFEQICHAAGYAHAHHVVHRDLKPANVMVGTHGEVQVMDWGLAKVLEDASFTEPDGSSHDPNATAAWRTNVGTWPVDGTATQTGSVLGTPAYMSPEQAGGEIKRITPRSDVFGLGAILCEILTGFPPYEGNDVHELRLQAIRGEMSEAMARLEQCQTEPEWISLCKRCLAFNPEDRPADGREVAAETATIRQTAEARAREAEVKREGAEVRAGEQAKQRRLTAWAGGTIAMVLIAGLAASLYQMNRANHERDEKADALRAEQLAREQARLAAENEKSARQQAEKERDEKERQRRYAQAIADFVRNDFLALTSVDGQERFAGASSGLSKNTTLRQLLDRASSKLSARKDLDPFTAAELHWMIGVNYRGVGAYPQAITHLEKSVQLYEQSKGSDDQGTIEALNSLAVALGSAGRMADSIRLHEQTLQAKIRTLGPTNPSTLITSNSLAGTYLSAGQPEKAIVLLEQILGEQTRQLGANHTETLYTMNNLAGAFYAARRIPEAIQQFEKLRNNYVDKYGNDHQETQLTLNNLAACYRLANRLPEAIQIFEQLRESLVKKYGADHPETLSTLNNLAATYNTAGRSSEAIAILEQVRSDMVTKLGADHPDVLNALNNLAISYALNGRNKDALPLHVQAAQGVAKRQFLLENASNIMTNAITSLEEAGQFEQAETWQRQWLDFIRKKEGTTSRVYASELASLGGLLLKQQKWKDAETTLKECLSLREKTQPDAWPTFNTMSLLGEAYWGQKRWSEAEPLLIKGYEGMKVRQKSMPSRAAERIPQAIERLVKLYDTQDKKDLAATWRQKLNESKGSK